MTQWVKSVRILKGECSFSTGNVLRFDIHSGTMGRLEGQIGQDLPFYLYISMFLSIN